MPYASGQRSGRYIVPNTASSTGRCTAKFLSIASALRGVMPVMELRRRDQPLQRTEIEAHVGVDERRLHAHHDEIRKERPLGKSQHVDRHVRQTARDRDVDQMQPRAGQPVHLLRRMMHGVKPPQRRDRVERAMHPVLREVGHEQQRDELHDGRPLRGPTSAPTGTAAQSNSIIAGFSVRIVSHLHEQRADEEVGRDRCASPRRKMPCSGSRANSRSSGTKTSE